MAGRQSRRDEQRSAFGYVVWHLYFYGRKDSQADEAMNAGGIAKPFTLCVSRKGKPFEFPEIYP
jgi:hypothetical protein